MNNEEAYLKEALKKSNAENETLKKYLAWAAFIAFLIGCVIWGGDRF